MGFSISAPARAARFVAGGLADILLTRIARRRISQLDRISLEACQRRTLLHLVHRARHTRFGRDHDFAGIRSVADYQQRVPLRSYESFWRDYWQPAFPCLDNVTWPGSIRYLALSSGTTSGSTKYIPVSAQMLRSNRKAGLTALALFRHAHPRVPLAGGKLFFLGGSTALRKEGAHALAGDLSGIAAATAPAWLRPFTYPPLELALLDDWDRKLELLARQAPALPISLVSGVPSWLLALFERLLQVTGRQRMCEVWPDLRLVLHGGTSFDPYRQLFGEVVGSSEIHFLETYPASEGFIAAEDPRQGLLRVIPDHDLFFELVPRDELTASRPTRHTLDRVELGVPYAVVLSTCAGLWSYVVGDVVCFEQRHPPLLRFLGRVQQYLSAFGEHLLGAEVEQAVARAAEVVKASLVDFHVGPLFPDQSRRVGRHCYLVEVMSELSAEQQERLVVEIDRRLAAGNDDYAAHRQGDLTLGPPELRIVPRGGFAGWMRQRKQLGGQHKVPRLDNSGRLTAAMALFFQSGTWDKSPGTD